MTPQQLIDLPGAGKAEAWLRKNGMWRLTSEDRLSMAMNEIAVAGLAMNKAINHLAYMENHE